MVKKLSCGIVALLVAGGVGLLALVGFVLLICFIIFITSSGPGDSRKARNLYQDPHYVVAGGWDYSRLPLIKPYSLKSCERNFDKNCSLGRDIDPREFATEEDVIRTVSKFNVVGNYFLAVSPANKYLPSGYQNFWFVLDMNNLKYRQFSICKWSSGEVDIGNDTLKGAVFTSEADFKGRLKELGIDPEIKLYPPSHFYQMFLDTGCCPWFPKPDK